MRAHETLERAGRQGGFPARGSASGLLAACPSDGSHDFYLSMMLDVPVPRVPMLRTSARLPPRGATRIRRTGSWPRGASAAWARSNATCHGWKGDVW
ncbi:hypothetical protein [Bifidobacterium longum]|uniref:hypothetical protein n=1 Tax=Bifidobacterium longum TaxID=216816 RepID=UPI00398C849C